MDRIADKLKKDPRVVKAKQLLTDALHDCQELLKGPKPADPALIHEYEHLLEQFAKMRAGKLFYPYIGSGMGKGPLVELMDGSIKYDFISGIGPNFWGHSDPGIMKTGVDAALTDTVMQGNLQQNIDAVQLSKTILRASGMNHIFITTSGAMANENGLKLAFQKRHPASRVLAFEHCFMGRTLVMSQISDKPKYREGLPNTIAVDYVPFYDAEHPEESTEKAVRILEEHIHRYPGQHAAMCMELIQGEAGFWVGSKAFFKRLIEILKKHQIIVIADEIQTFGRTEKLFAFQHFDLQEDVDIVIMGKLSQICATLFKANMAPKPALLSQTFTASTSAIAASQYIFDHLLSGDFFGPRGKNMRFHAYFEAKLKAIAKQHPNWVRGPYGIGAMIGFTPFDGSMEKAMSLVHKLFKNGVLAFIAGGTPTRIRFLIPVAVITEEDIDNVVMLLEKTLSEEAK